MTNAEARFNVALRPQKPQGSLGRGAQDGHLDFHTAPELCVGGRRGGGEGGGVQTRGFFIATSTGFVSLL